MFKSKEFWDVRGLFLAPFEGAQSKLKARVIAHNVAFYEAGDKFWSYIVVDDAEGIRFGYGD